MIAISTEFSILLSARYRQEREGGAGPARALELAYASTGAAVLASGVTAIAGFAALIASDIRMLRDFGIVTVVDLSVSLIGVMIAAAGGAPVGRAARTVPGARPRAAQAAAGAGGLVVVSDDRFGDLGEGREEERASIGERLAERDRTHPEPVKPPQPPRATNKYAWAVGILFVMVLSVILFVETLPNSGDALFGPKLGTQLKDFAAPSVRSDLEGDANVCQSEPCPKQAGEAPACSLDSDSVVNVCRLRRRPLVLTFVFDRGADCYPQVDRTERVLRKIDGVQFATVFFTRKERSEVRNLVEARGWTQPVGIDQDGAVANLYGVGGCPTTIFARAGGKVAAVDLGNLTEDQLLAKARRIKAARDSR